MKTTLIVLFALLLSGCATIQPEDQVQNIQVSFLPAADVHQVCVGYEACAIGHRIYMAETGDWTGELWLSLEWVFTDDLVEVDGNTITGAAWPTDQRLGHQLAESQGWPPGDYRYHRLLAHEIMHVFGMQHGQPERVIAGR